MAPRFLRPGEQPRDGSGRFAQWQSERSHMHLDAAPAAAIDDDFTDPYAIDRADSILRDVQSWGVIDLPEDATALESVIAEGSSRAMWGHAPAAGAGAGIDGLITSPEAAA